MARTPWPLQSLLGHGCRCFTKAPCAQFRGGPGRWHIMGNRGCSDAWLLPGWMVKGWWNGSRGLWLMLVVVMVMVALACWQGLFLRTFVWMVGKRWSSGCHLKWWYMLIHQLAQDHSKRHLSSPAPHLMAALSALPSTIPSSSNKSQFHRDSSNFSPQNPTSHPLGLLHWFTRARTPWPAKKTSTFLGDVIQYLVGMFLHGLIPSESCSAISWIFGG